MALQDATTDELIELAKRGDRSAVEELLGRYRQRLRRMLTVRMDPRLAARVDPSDVIQETLMDASRRLADYLREPPLPFYPWLRQIAWDKLVDIHRHHLHARKRSVTRHESLPMDLPDASANDLAARLIGSETSAHRRLLRKELRARVRAVLDKMSTAEREVLVLRYLEQLKISEIASILGSTEGAINMRQFRAVKRLRSLLDREFSEDGP